MVQLLWRFLKKLKMELPYDPAIPPLGIFLNELKAGSQRATCTLVLTPACPQQLKHEQPKCPLTNERISKMWSIRAMEYDSALTRKEILTPAMPWMNLEDVTLREISQSQKTDTARFHLYEVPRAVRIMETGSRRVGARGWGRGTGSECLMGPSFTFTGRKLSGDGWWSW